MKKLTIALFMEIILLSSGVFGENIIYAIPTN